MAQVREKIDFDDGIEYAIPAGRRPPGGVIIRQDPVTHADVFMYKRKPGVYYSGHGTEVSPVMAQRAGFDIERNAAALEKMQKMADFEANWKAANADTEARIIVERGGYRLEERPDQGYYVVHIDSGDRVTKDRTAKSEQEGRDWLDMFAGPEPEKKFDGTPESVKVADGDVHRIGRESRGRTNRRSRSDPKPTGDVRPAGNP